MGQLAHFDGYQLVEYCLRHNFRKFIAEKHYSWWFCCKFQKLPVVVRKITVTEVVGAVAHRPSWLDTDKVAAHTDDSVEASRSHLAAPHSSA